MTFSCFHPHSMTNRLCWIMGGLDRWWGRVHYWVLGSVAALSQMDWYLWQLQLFHSPCTRLLPLLSTCHSTMIVLEGGPKSIVLHCFQYQYNYPQVIIWLTGMLVERHTSIPHSWMKEINHEYIPRHVMRHLWQITWHSGNYSPSPSISPANSHFTNCFISINHPTAEAI
jgi:hypothetical protein